MAGNFKYIVFLLFGFSFFSCLNKEDKTELGAKLISENLPKLLDNSDYFNISDDPVSVGVYQYTGEIKSDQEIVVKKFQEKFGLENEEIFHNAIKVERIPKKIGKYPLFLDVDNTFQKQNSTIKVSFVNLIISKNNQYGGVEVIKSFGSGTKFEIYYFKHVGNKWIFKGKELISLG